MTDMPLLECPCGAITKVEGGVVRVTCKCGITYIRARAVEPIYVPQVENLKSTPQRGDNERQ